MLMEKYILNIKDRNTLQERGRKIRALKKMSFYYKQITPGVNYEYFLWGLQTGAASIWNTGCD